MSSSERVGKDKFVQFTYFINDEAGKTLEHIDRPISCVFLRHNRLYGSVERLMEGCSVGDEISSNITPKEGVWGISNPALIIEQNIQDVPPQYRTIGAEAQFKNEKGESKSFFVSKIEGNTLTLNGNHPFAGRTMSFHLKITLIRDATMPEMINGVSDAVEDNSTLPPALH
ncbi:MAG: hypothetical protein KAG28_05925 [Cocleimonas sp.]|nr:hypothetical protein [Cocleimonas sp.]